MTLFTLITLSAGAYAATIPVTCPDGFQTTVGTPDAVTSACTNHQTGGPERDSIEGSGNVEADCTDTSVNKDNCGIISYLVIAIRVLSGLVGVVVVIMITVGGIQYSTARDDPQAAAAAKGRITNALIALVVYLFIFAFLQWLVPGGIF